jgi:endonuclease/exonuclease/phosphatase (EEP) superfamily protein YafD
MLASYVGLRLCGQLRPWEYALAVVAGLGLLWQLYSIAPYTTLYPTQMLESHAKDDSSRISLLAYNVLFDNRNVEALRGLIRDNNPDVILLSETSQWWLEQLEGLEDGYPYTLFQPQENGYGMLLYSRLELEDPEIRFLIEPEIPSIRTKVRLRSGTVVTLYGIHPRPPGTHRPDEDKDTGIEEDEEKEADEREDSDKRDAELLSVAKEAKRTWRLTCHRRGRFQ